MKENRNMFALFLVLKLNDMLEVLDSLDLSFPRENSVRFSP